jgi:enoyl-CoA hydratase
MQEDVMAATLELDTDRMLAEKDGAIGWITFNNPAKHNATSVDMWAAIPAILDDYENDPAVRVIVLKGAGEKAFVAGADISEFDKVRSNADQVARYETLADGATERLAKASKPTIAMIRGYCIGGGLGIALACDLRIASNNSKFAVPAAKLGLGYRAAGIKKLVNVVGPSFAKEIFYTARQFTAQEAIAMGLINRAVAESELAAYVADYCTTIAQNAPLTILAVKRTVEELTRLAGAPDLERCEKLVMDCFGSEDYIEGRRAFMEKRKPAFHGR